MASSLLALAPVQLHRCAEKRTSLEATSLLKLFTQQLQQIYKSLAHN